MGGEFFRKTASYGHFGVSKPALENVENKANQLIKASKVFCKKFMTDEFLQD